MLDSLLPLLHAAAATAAALAAGAAKTCLSYSLARSPLRLPGSADTWHNFWSIGFSFLISTGQFTAYRNANSWEVETMVSRKTNPAVSPVINPNDHLHLVSNTSRKKCLVIIGFNCVECLEL